MGATLADGGVNPLTGVRVVSAEVARATLVVMAVAGLYETSGDWLLRVGVPGRSGIGGGLVAVSPGKGALGSFSPLLDHEGRAWTSWLPRRWCPRLRARPEGRGRAAQVGSRGVTAAVTVAAVVVYMVAHEFTHGTALWALTRVRPTYAVRLPYLSTGSQALLPRRDVVVVAVAPFALWPWCCRPCG